MERQNNVVQTPVAVSRVMIPAMLQTAAAPATSATPRQRRLTAPGSLAISGMTIDPLRLPPNPGHELVPTGAACHTRSRNSRMSISATLPEPCAGTGSSLPLVLSLYLGKLAPVRRPRSLTWDCGWLSLTRKGRGQTGTPVWKPASHVRPGPSRDCDYCPASSASKRRAVRRLAVPAPSAASKT